MHGSRIEAVVPPFSLDRPVRSLVLHPVLQIPAGTSLNDAIRLMLEARPSIGECAVIVDPHESRPLATLSCHALMQGVLSRSQQGEEQRIDAQAEPLVSIALVDGCVRDVFGAMAVGRQKRALIVDAAGHMLGALALSDLLGGETLLTEEIATSILASHSIAELAASAGEGRNLLRKLVVQGVGAEQVMQASSLLNDLVALQAIISMATRFELPDVAWSWMTFGSEGRIEQTFATDQDNGLIFDVPQGQEPEALRNAFLPFAQAVNQALDDCGVPLCKGQIMAGNPAWCLSIGEWRAKFRDWIVCGDAKALLNASIFFDFRVLYGNAPLVEDLRQWLLKEAAASSLFLRLMAQNALQCQPPIGFIRSFVLDKDTAYRDTIDLKTVGVRPYVDAARLFALAHGVTETSTAQRLRQLSQLPGFGKEDLDAVIDGFHFVQMLRLRSQLRPGVAEPAVNRINPYQLNSMARSSLKQAFRQARRLQLRLKADHRL